MFIVQLAMVGLYVTVKVPTAASSVVSVMVVDPPRFNTAGVTSSVFDAEATETKGSKSSNRTTKDIAPKVIFLFNIYSSIMDYHLIILNINTYEIFILIFYNFLPELRMEPKNKLQV
jgi:hypothetical protein